ncbi:aldolase/citrate lyase family protein [Sphaerisporangium sp. NPDC051011]|uniref:HpcH/HpaI aldolase family protein n=1 Tax=Sphaerisporangium sp. NPDC051011 TaxID=3155792 RepID=UPI0033DB2939
MIGTWLKLDTFETVEIAAAAGLDFVIIDLEHSLISTSTLSAMLSIAGALDLKALVRIPDHASSVAKVALDNGAAGIVVPNVESVQEAESVVARVKFPPLGSRGLSTSARAGRWGLTEQSAYMAAQNSSSTLLMQIESPRAVHEAVRIAAVPGVDGLLVGPADLSAAVGSTAADGTASLLAALEKSCAEGGVFLGTAASADPEQARRLLNRGYRLLAMSSDAVLLRGAAAGLRAGWKQLLAT